MVSIKQKIYNHTPSTIKNIFLTLYNFRLKKWHGKRYYNAIEEYEKMFFKASYTEIKRAQEKRFLEFIKFSKENNEYYTEKLKDIEINTIGDIVKIPILEKNDLKNSKIISNIKDKLVVNHTGGTTGIPLKSYYTVNDVQERQGNLDFFRGMFGYRFGSKTAWFSGKMLTTTKDISKNIFWVKDYVNHITYYSTFHMKKDYIDYMVEEMNKSQTEFFVGFPSAIYAIAYRIKAKELKTNFKLKAIFPTSEPLLAYQKALIVEVFNCPVPNQYASSEGAPFIYECPSGNLHYDMYSGIFEKRYPNSDSNEVLVTAFPTHSMPLIRYAIGDSVQFYKSDKKCTCGSKMPLIKKIEGRKMAFIYSKERGIVGITNITNIRNCSPDIEQLQVIQNRKDTLLIKVVSSADNHNSIIVKLKYRLHSILGDNININFEFVDEIPNEKSGKFLMIKNTLSMEECI